MSELTRKEHNVSVLLYHLVCPTKYRKAVITPNIDENGTLKAEFLALNEQIKNQLNARKQEITQIFRERGVKLSDLNVQQGSEFARPTNLSEANSRSDKTSNSETADGAAETEDSGNQTSYRI